MISAKVLTYATLAFYYGVAQPYFAWKLAANEKIIPAECARKRETEPARGTNGADLRKRRDAELSSATYILSS